MARTASGFLAFTLESVVTKKKPDQSAGGHRRCPAGGIKPRQVRIAVSRDPGATHLKRAETCGSSFAFRPTAVTVAAMRYSATGNQPDLIVFQRPAGFVEYPFVGHRDQGTVVKLVLFEM